MRRLNKSELNALANKILADIGPQEETNEELEKIHKKLTSEFKKFSKTKLALQITEYTGYRMPSMFVKWATKHYPDLYYQLFRSGSKYIAKERRYVNTGMRFPDNVWYDMKLTANDKSTITHQQVTDALILSQIESKDVEGLISGAKKILGL